MEYQFTNDKPIYLQLIDYFKAQIISGELPEGSRLDSVRAQVNPNTMQKALSELERMGLVRTERTSGRFITDDKDMIRNMKKEVAATEIAAFLERMKALGFDKDEVIKIIEEE